MPRPWVPAFAFIAMMIPGASVIASTVLIDKAAIALPDTHELTQRQEQTVVNFAQSTLTPDKRLLAVWVNSQQTSDSATFFPSRFRYADAYVIRALEPIDASVDDFRHAKQTTKSDLAKVVKISTLAVPEGLDQLKTELRSRNIDPDSAVSLGAVNAQLLAEGENQITHLIVTHIRATPSGSSPITKWLLTCSNVLLIHGKIVQLNVYGEIIDGTDQRWVTNECIDLELIRK